jgi:hypothetical protein
MPSAFGPPEPHRSRELIWAAREISLYNEMEKLGLTDTVAHDRDDHSAVKKLVSDADSTSVKADNYDDVLRRAFEAFDHHAREEEEEQLPLLISKIDAETSDVRHSTSHLTNNSFTLCLQKFARAFLSARTKVPSRPHPAAPQSGGAAQKLAGMQASLTDKVVEKLGGRHFVDLKFEHPTL